jgi:hypothetical protein
MHTYMGEATSLLPILSIVILHILFAVG